MESQLKFKKTNMLCLMVGLSMVFIKIDIKNTSNYVPF